MSFLQTQNNTNNRNLTEQQQKFLDALSGEAQGDIKAALQVAGYKDTSYYAVVKSLRQEIIDTANTILAHSAPKAAKKLVDVLESDEPIPQVNAKLQAAQTLLDRVGVAKKESINSLITEASLISYRLFVRQNWEIIRKEKIIIKDKYFERYKMKKNFY